MWSWRSGVRDPSLTPKHAGGPDTGQTAATTDTADTARHDAARPGRFESESCGERSDRARHRGPSSGIGATVARSSPPGVTPSPWLPGAPTGSTRCSPSAAGRRPPRSDGRADLSDPAAAADLALEIWDHFGGLDVVINNAAVPMRRHVSRLTMAEVERTMRINYLSPVAISLAVLPRMLERKSGTIVNVSSLGGRLGITTEAAYSGSKFALAGWSESMAIDLDRSGVSVKLILPGAIDTEIWDQPDNDAPLYDGRKESPSRSPGPSSTPSTAIASSTTCPT